MREANTAEGGSDMSDIDASSFIPSTSLPPELMPEIDPAVAESPVIRFPACGPLESRHLGSACDVGRDLPGQREIVKEGGGHTSYASRLPPLRRSITIGTCTRALLRPGRLVRSVIESRASTMR